MYTHTPHTKSHLAWRDGKRESPVTGLAIGLIVESGLLLQLAQVKHLVEAAVVVGDHVEDHVTVILKGINVMVDHHRSRVVLGLHLFAGLSVYQVDQGLSMGPNKQEVKRDTRLTPTISDSFSVVRD